MQYTALGDACSPRQGCPAASATCRLCEAATVDDLYEVYAQLGLGDGEDLHVRHGGGRYEIPPSRGRRGGGGRGRARLRPIANALGGAGEAGSVDWRRPAAGGRWRTMRQAMAANAGVRHESPLKAMKGPKKDDGIDRV